MSHTFTVNVNAFTLKQLQNQVAVCPIFNQCSTLAVCNFLQMISCHFAPAHLKSIYQFIVSRCKITMFLFTMCPILPRFPFGVLKIHLVIALCNKNTMCCSPTTCAIPFVLSLLVVCQSCSEQLRPDYVIPCNLTLDSFAVSVFVGYFGWRWQKLRRAGLSNLTL